MAVYSLTRELLIISYHRLYILKLYHYTKMVGTKRPGSAIQSSESFLPDAPYS